MLDALRTNRIKHLFSEALDLDEVARVALLSRTASEDPTIERELRVLLGAHSRASEFLREPTAGVNSPLDRDAFSPLGEAVGDVIDRYQLQAIIGEGGFGRVYRAQQREPVARIVALKVIKAGMDTQQVIARFEAERQVLALMDHPSIASVFDAGATATGRPYFVMELVDGQPITIYADARRLTVDERLVLFQKVCAAVQHAHTKGVIHRDLKPSNVLIIERDSQPQPKVIDFGIAKATSTTPTDRTLLTDMRQMVGTPEYMSPEQAGFGSPDVDTRSDVYALGVLLYQLLTGTTPFDGARLRAATSEELQRIIREEEPPRPSDCLASLKSLDSIASARRTDSRVLISTVRGELDWITLKALDKDRERRYGSPAELAEDIRRCLDHEPVVACPPSRSYRARKFIRRHRAGVLASSLVALGLIGGATVAMIGMVKARVAAERVRRSAQEVDAVNGFMRMVLTSASPEQLGAAVRLAEVLDVASAQASEQFAGHPATEAQAREVLASAYFRLSLWNQAGQQFSQAAELWRQSFGDLDPRTIDASMGLAHSLVNMARGREAQAVLDDLLPRLDLISVERDQRWIEARSLQANVLKVRSRLDESAQLYKDLLKDAAAQGISESMQVELLDGLLDVLRFRINRSDLPSTATDLEEYQRCANELLERGRRLGGADAERRTFHAMQDLANIALHRGEYAQAEAQCRALLDESRDRLGECHISRVCAMLSLADALRLQGKTAEPADLYLRVIECERARSGADSVMLVTYLSDAQIYFERDGRWSQAEACCREAIDKVTAMGAHIGTFLLEARLAHFISHQAGRSDEAREMFESLMSRAHSMSPDEHDWLRLYYADHLTLAGEFESAERLLLKIAPSTNVNPKELRAHPPDDLLYQFQTLYEAWGMPDKAEQFEAQRIQLLEGQLLDPH